MRPIEIYKQIIEIEKEYDLFDEKFDTVYFWKLVRLKLWLYMLKEYGYIETVKGKNKNFKERIAVKLELIKNSLLHSSFDSGKKDILIFENPRKIKFKETYIDPYTHDFIKKIKGQNLSYEIIDDGFNGLHYEPTGKNRKFSENLYYDMIYPYINRFRKLKPTSEENGFIEKLENIIAQKFNKNYPLKNEVIWQVTGFMTQYKKYSKLFIKKSPQAIYLICSYGKEGMIHAAKLQNIEVVELQHGTIDKMNLGYSFENSKSVTYFPDRLLLFGKYWSDSTSIPLEKDKIEVIGYSFFNSQLKNYNHVLQEKKRVLFISQWPIGKTLSEKAVEVARDNKDFEIIYRLHPQEKNSWKLSYPALYQNRDLSNLTIDDSDSDLHLELAKSKYVIGVYSTAIYESLAFDCTVLLLNLFGIEYMDYLIKNEYVMVQNIEDKIDIELIENTNTISKEYIFGGGE